MRVLFVTGLMPSLERPGTLAPVARQIESLSPYLEETASFEIIGWPILKYFTAISGIRRAANGYDLVHAHYGLCGFSSILGSPLPVVISLMGSDIQNSPNTDSWLGQVRIIWEHVLSRYACRRASAVIVKNRLMAEKLVPVKGTVIPNGVDISTFTPMEKKEARNRLCIEEKEVMVLFGGNPSDKNKNYSLAEKALTKARELSGKSIRCIPLKGIQPEEVPLFMNACDCVLFTSLREGSSNVVKEAMACNTPVVSVPVGDTEYLLDGVDGCRLCSYDFAEIGSALVEVLERNAPSKGREAIITKRLDLCSVAERILEIYRQTMKSG